MYQLKKKSSKSSINIKYVNYQVFSQKQFGIKVNNFMQGKETFNIITGEILPSRRHNSMQQLDRGNKHMKLPALGVPKDKNAFKYTYFDSAADLNPESRKNQLQTYKATTQNFTFQASDLITHRALNRNFVQLRRADFQTQIASARVKGLLTRDIDLARKNAPNYHEDFESMVKTRSFHRKREICASTMEIEKGYGGAKFFRKYK